jgi:curved DNA-binding protein CbpA
MPASGPSDDFVDYYEVLQISPNAEYETIQRVFRLLAQRYHPDNRESGNEQTFQLLLKAYQELGDPTRRAAYDAHHREQVRLTWQIFDQDAAPQGRDAERRKRSGILGLLYRKRQTTPAQPGMNIREMEDLLGIPKEHLEFSLWYLKETGDIRPGDNGRYMISAKGVESYEDASGPDSDRPNVHLLPAAKNTQAV